MPGTVLSLCAQYILNPYLVPLNFGMDIEDGQLYLYFHCAKEGKKLDLIQKDNRASFEMDHAHQLVLNDEKMSCTMEYESVTGKGFIEIVSEDKKSGVKNKQHAKKNI